LAVGFVSYGVSIVLDVYALRYVGAARESAYFATAPFAGALIAVPVLGESVAAHEAAGGLVMAAGVALLIRPRGTHQGANDDSRNEVLYSDCARCTRSHDAGLGAAHPGDVVTETFRGRLMEINLERRTIAIDAVDRRTKKLRNYFCFLDPKVKVTREEEGPDLPA
jgi:hypothetical protein